MTEPSAKEAGPPPADLSVSTSPYTLAVDAMGGDHAPDVVLAGLEKAAVRHPNIRILLLGDEAVLGPALKKRFKKAAAICTVRHAPTSISMEMKPTAALRLRGSSLRMAMEAVASGEALGVVSAGNSGAMLALAKIIVKALPGISRPAMAAVQPSARGDVVMLDLGANIACDTRNLVEFAIMGEAFAQAALGLEAPSIGLLNVGAEELKGDERLRQASERLKNSPLGPRFSGFIEGHDITAGTTDVVVTDGFTGNVALKTGEGALKLAFGLLKSVFQANLLSRIGYLLVKPGLERMREWIDPSRYNGAVFVGLNGVVVKSHGGADAEGFAAAIDVAFDAVANRLNDKIRQRLSQLDMLTPPDQALEGERA
ncbi:phosphate acyltransferase PlsX [Oecophyllibacter saccharovorans]|uniref:phosphate acyltransferase PlsX n=1 Tax=Oecophyllibacter saccharovorans TaxID=2558360 RepID=UPI0011425F61|nr:phosphate acyltransferase PlsX [Oecophyllibacter saccharovorans]QDH14643.1 phosphate acyltransferase PlsX [Oecophyllibacter saccharovorans]TPW34844.1 phosphate acyltransferase PlsX [Oecophyllibacter saccharovorans]